MSVDREREPGCFMRHAWSGGQTREHLQPPKATSPGQKSCLENTVLERRGTLQRSPRQHLGRCPLWPPQCLIRVTISPLGSFSRFRALAPGRRRSVALTR